MRYEKNHFLKKAVIVCFCCSISMQVFSENTDFNDFKRQQLQGVDDVQGAFDQYKKALEEGFASYKKTYQAAYKAREKNVTQVWGEYRPGDKKSWVEYEKDGVRKSVNFESGEVELEMLVDKDESKTKIEAALKKRILTLMLMSKRDAFKNDPVAQAVEKKIASNPAVQTATVPTTPIMGSLVAELESGNREKITQISKQYAQQAKVDVRPAKKENKKIVRVKFKISTDAPKKSEEFLRRAKAIADKEKVPLTVVMAVMEAESAFNPMAKSHIPAYGLMQIVPRSAGKDATAYLFGKAKVLSPSYLYNPDKNIEIGGAYLHILYFRYLKKIKDPASRLYCTIAAYNTGAGNVARAFTGKTNINRAAVIINKLTPKQVYQKLRQDLPYKETKNYIQKVSKNMRKYQ